MLFIPQLYFYGLFFTVKGTVDGELYKIQRVYTKNVCHKGLKLLTVLPVREQKVTLSIFGRFYL